MVENRTLVQVRRDGHAQKYVAQVECVGYDCDLAVLCIDDEQFWRGLPALSLPYGLPPTMSEVAARATHAPSPRSHHRLLPSPSSASSPTSSPSPLPFHPLDFLSSLHPPPPATHHPTLPPTREQVIAVGFPAGGEELSTSRAVVNRILLGGPNRDLCVQINPGVQPGQPGGPVFLSSGQLVGMATSAREGGAPLTDYIIPMPVIHTFLKNAAVTGVYASDTPVAAGASVGKSVDCYRVQPMENVELRLQMGLVGRPSEGEDGGVLITRVPKCSSAYGQLQEDDVRCNLFSTSPPVSTLLSVVLFLCFPSLTPPLRSAFSLSFPLALPSPPLLSLPPPPLPSPAIHPLPFIPPLLSSLRCCSPLTAIL